MEPHCPRRRSKRFPLQRPRIKEWSIPSDDELRAFLAKRMEHNGVGVVIGVIEPAGRRVIAYGRSGNPDGRPLDGDTIFVLGSVSKSFVGLVLADMIRRGEVRLDDPASKFLPARREDAPGMAGQSR